MRWGNQPQFRRIATTDDLVCARTDEFAFERSSSQHGISQFGHKDGLGERSIPRGDTIKGELHSNHEVTKVCMKCLRSKAILQAWHCLTKHLQKPYQRVLSDIL